MTEIKYCTTVYEEPDKGYVYVIKMGDYYKIGKTKKPKERFGEYTLLPIDPETIYCEYVYNYSQVETDLHETYKEKLVRGEWFSLNEKDLEQIYNFLKENKKCGKKVEKKVWHTSARVKIVSPQNVIREFNEEEILKLLKNNISTYFALGVLKLKMNKDNILFKNGKKYKAVDLARDMNITRQWASSHISKLKELNVIAEIETNKGKLIVMNPNYYHRGEDVEQRVYDLFENKK